MPVKKDEDTHGGFRDLARLISTVENGLPGYERILEELKPTTGIPVVGITGPPGAGKSTLIDALLAELLTGHYLPLKGKGVGVVTVDPTSPFTSGALLGDRLRMGRHFSHPKVYIRSLATRGALGGLSYKTMEVTDVMKSWGFDMILVETVGVGQSEMEVASLADVTAVVLVPESGDDVQAVKAGLMEAADVFVINKSDREGADRLEAFIREAAVLDPDHPHECPVVKTVATEGHGAGKLLQAILDAYASVSAERKQRLLFARAIHLMRDYCLQRIDDEAMRKELLERATNDPGFNLYVFARAAVEKSRFIRS